MSSRERNLLIGLGVIVVAAAAFFLLTRGDGEQQVAAPTTPSPQVAAPVEPLPRPPRTPAFFGGRDPFVPLVVADVGTGDGDTDGGTDGTGDGDTDGGTSQGNDGFPPPTGGQVGDQPGVTVGGRTVTLLDVFPRQGAQFVQVEVDREIFTVREGERFASNFEALSIDGVCARFLYGDESFDVCEGGRQT
jgi:hypothetical protein